MDIQQQVANEIKQFQGLYQSVIEFFVNYSFQIIGALLITLLGWFVAKKVALYVERVCNKYKLDVTVTKYIANIVKVAIIAATKYYFQIQYKINMEIFQALRAKGIKIPYPTYNIQK